MLVNNHADCTLFKGIVVAYTTIYFCFLFVHFFYLFFLFYHIFFCPSKLESRQESDKAIGAVFQYLWSLWTRQKELDTITKRKLDPFNMTVHHIKPLSKGGTNEVDNLILIAPDTHKQLHYGKDLNKRFEKYRKHLK